jgi:hypothetical protein
MLGLGGLTWRIRKTGATKEVQARGEGEGTYDFDLISVLYEFARNLSRLVAFVSPEKLLALSLLR